MKKKYSHTKLQKEVEHTYALLGKKKRLEPNPFLYTRIEQRLDEIIENKTSHRIIWTKWTWQPLYMSLLLVVVLFIGVKIGSIHKPITNQIAEIHTTEYFLNDMNQETLEIALLNE